MGEFEMGAAKDLYSLLLQASFITRGSRKKDSWGLVAGPVTNSILHSVSLLQSWISIVKMCVYHGHAIMVCASYFNSIRGPLCLAWHNGWIPCISRSKAQGKFEGPLNDAKWGESFSKHLWFAIVIVFLAEMGTGQDTLLWQAWIFRLKYLIG